MLAEAHPAYSASGLRDYPSATNSLRLADLLPSVDFLRSADLTRSDGFLRSVDLTRSDGFLPSADLLPSVDSLPSADLTRSDDFLPSAGLTPSVDSLRSAGLPLSGGFLPLAGLLRLDGFLSAPGYSGAGFPGSANLAKEHPGHCFPDCFRDAQATWAKVWKGSVPGFPAHPDKGLRWAASPRASGFPSSARHRRFHLPRGQ